MKKVHFYAEIGKHNHQSDTFEYEDDATSDEIQHDFEEWILDQVRGKVWNVEGEDAE